MSSEMSELRVASLVKGSIVPIVVRLAAARQCEEKAVDIVQHTYDSLSNVFPSSLI